jgi:hypothetical protein
VEGSERANRRLIVWRKAENVSGGKATKAEGPDLKPLARTP